MRRRIQLEVALMMDAWHLERLLRVGVDEDFPPETDTSLHRCSIIRQMLSFGLRSGCQHRYRYVPYFLRPGLPSLRLSLTFVSLRPVAIAYLMQKTPYVFPIVGGSKVDQLLQNIDALDVSLTSDQIKFLDAASPFNPGFPYTGFVSSRALPLKRST